MKEYHKIETLYERDNVTKKLKKGKFRDGTIESLKDIIWQFTEKVDGTNIRINWDGHKVTIGGRTDKAQIPVPLMNRLNELFLGEANAQIFEQKFGETEVTFYGEGYGAGIQTGGNYKDTQDFILFDVLINDTIYLTRNDVEEVANYFNVEVVPIRFEGTLEAGVERLLTIDKISEVGKKEAPLEGYVARPKIELRDRLGRRIITKIKIRDFD